jgi:bacterioferritin-associated ferredoxin
VIACHCHAVRADEIRTEVRLGAESVELIGARCHAGTRCGGCIPAVEAIVCDELARAGTAVRVRH